VDDVVVDVAGTVVVVDATVVLVGSIEVVVAGAVVVVASSVVVLTASVVVVVAGSVAVEVAGSVVGSPSPAGASDADVDGADATNRVVPTARRAISPADTFDFTKHAPLRADPTPLGGRHARAPRNRSRAFAHDRYSRSRK
jgi:hypothetical protein